MSEKKRAMTAEEIDRCSRELGEKLFAHPAYQRAGSIYAYLSYNQEVRTGPILERAWADGKRVAVPKVLEGKRMEFLWITPESPIAPGFYGIPEPEADGPEADDRSALILMPGLAFDPAGGRMGYGGGFYDRYLAEHPGHPTIALCYGFQVVEKLELQDHDLPVDAVLWSGSRQTG